MTQFNLEEWLQDKSRKVVTRRGNPVRIICTDRKHGEDDLPIVFLEETNDGEVLLSCQSNGMHDNYKDYQTQYDLFFADEEELTEFESKLFSTFSEIWQDYLLGREIDVEKVIKENSKEFLDLARKELKYEMIEVLRAEYEKGRSDILQEFPHVGDTKAYQEGVKEGRRLERQDIDKELDEAYKSRDEVVYLEGYDQGKEDTLKDFPKWKKATKDKDFDRHVLLLEDDRVVIASCVYKDEYYIELNNLKTLPKEE